ncbi:U3 small nucleolar RNA-associated protein 8 [Nakaseomyces bracarensis]|uniref:U3 small nucleolar RNA-associated protein 8 n=1 Tax=Nakaseomyces bracarensis TaxID=273131 RepID=A0ABR4NPI1_9SACH
MPSLSQPFRLAVLPKIASLHNFSQKKTYIKVADSFTPESNSVLLGISGSAISHYVITPTPRLTFNVPIPSTHLVTACNMGTQGEDDTEEVWCYALSANNRSHTLNCLIRKIDATNSSVTDNNPQFSLKCKEEIINIEVDAKNKVITVLFDSGMIQFYDLELKLLNSISTPYKDIKIVKTFQENGIEFMLLISDVKDSKVALQLYEVNATKHKVKELNSSIIENFNLEDSLLCYQFGKLYRLYKDEVEVYSIPSLQLSLKVKIPFLTEALKEHGDDCLISFKSIASNRILLTVKNKIYLLDLLHKSILSEREIGHMKTFQILKTAMNRDSTESKLTIALGISTKNGQNPTSALEIINIDVGSNSLKDSVGKSFLKSTTGGKPIQYKTLIDSEEGTVPEINYDKILSKLSKVNKSEEFDNIFFKELKIKEDLFTETCRFVNNQQFLGSVLDLIFKNLDYAKECPRSLIFLLTHPLFPRERAAKLLHRFKDNSRLFKQTVVTCPNLPLNELLEELFSIRNAELVLDISLRILQDYTRDSIKDEIKKLDKVSAENFLNFIIKMEDNGKDLQEYKRSTPQLFKLLSLVLDSIGLFGLDNNLLNHLSTYIEKQVEVAERNSVLWNMMDSTSIGISRPSHSHTSKSSENSQSAYIVDYLEI